jgi:predicted DNA-binding transcriptional regulator AlpA
MEYEFTLKFKLDPKDAIHDELVERLGAAGCTDALVGLGVAGHLGLEFAREASSAEEAILSAMADVKGAIPSAKLVEVGPDFVGLTDVADLVGVSRQNMRKLMVAHADEFPAPIHMGSASVWHLALVLEFMLSRQYKLARAMVDVAQTAMRVNITKEAALVEPIDTADFRYALAA